MKLLSIDPGVTHCGAALFHDGRLSAAKAFRGAGFKGDLARVARLAQDIVEWGSSDGMTLVVEWPQVYAGRQRGRKDPNNLLPLAALDGAIAMGLYGAVRTVEEVRLYLPHDWKGSKQPNPTARWVLSRLDEKERAEVEDLGAFEVALTEAERSDEEVGHYVHNTLDAVGLGLHYLGRLGRRRVIAR